MIYIILCRPLILILSYLLTLYHSLHLLHISFHLYSPFVYIFIVFTLLVTALSHSII
ncbi:hypothetical protein M432DRAFT_605125, partial [Thermoascus aurantiacus ATCC 26904]